MYPQDFKRNLVRSTHNNEEMSRSVEDEREIVMSSAPRIGGGFVDFVCKKKQQKTTKKELKNETKTVCWTIKALSRRDLEKKLIS